LRGNVGFVRGANSLPTGGREEVCAAGAGAELEVRPAVERCPRAAGRCEADLERSAGHVWWS
jgi:hypothetical protein